MQVLTDRHPRPPRRVKLRRGSSVFKDAGSSITTFEDDALRASRVTAFARLTESKFFRNLG